MTIPTPSRRLPALGAVLTVALLAGACSGADDKTADTKSDVPTSSVSASSIKEASATQPSKAATTAEGPAIATSGDPTSTAGGIEITSLKRDSGQLVTLRFFLVNKGTKDVTMSLGDSTGARDVSGVYLVDPDGLKKYLTVQDAQAKCLCSTNLFNLKPGDRLNLFATFPAPPPEVKTVTVVVPSFQPLNDVPLS